MMASRTTPAQNLLVKRLRKADPAGVPVREVNLKTLDGLIRRGIAETYVRPTLFSQVEMVRLVDGGAS